MLLGLATTSMAIVLMGASFFQRRSRSGWLDELDGIRHQALVGPGGEVAAAMASVPEDPGGATPARGEASIGPVGWQDPGRDWLAGVTGVAGPAVGAARLTSGSVEPARASDPPGRSRVEVRAPRADAAPVAQAAEPAEPAEPTERATWVQPAPHPIRPSEMWHAGPVPPQGEERVGSADLAPPDTVGVNRFARLWAGIDESTSEARGPAPTPRPDRAMSLSVRPDPATPVASGPVGRRPRGSQARHVLPTSTPPPSQSDLPRRHDAGAVEDRPLRENVGGVEDRSPLVDAPLPPASGAPPRRASTESVPAAPSGNERPLAIGTDGELSTVAAIVRFGEDHQARAVAGPDGFEVTLDRGWCWVAPGSGTGPIAAVRLAIPDAVLTVDPGATVLSVVEADGSTFVLVAAGAATLGRDGDDIELHRGAMVMLPAAGAPQVDSADDDEVAADPLVAQNRLRDRAMSANVAISSAG